MNYGFVMYRTQYFNAMLSYFVQKRRSFTRRRKDVYLTFTKPSSSIPTIFLVDVKWNGSKVIAYFERRRQ